MAKGLFTDSSENSNILICFFSKDRLPTEEIKHRLCDPNDRHNKVRNKKYGFQSNNLYRRILD